MKKNKSHMTTLEEAIACETSTEKMLKGGCMSRADVDKIIDSATGTRIVPGTVIDDFSTMCRESDPYKCAMQAAQVAYDKSQLVRDLAHAYLRVGLKMPACTDVKTNEVVCAEDIFEARLECLGSENWAGRLLAVTLFMVELERLTQRKAFMRDVQGDSDRISVTVLFRVGDYHYRQHVDKCVKGTKKKASAKTDSKAKKHGRKTSK